MLQHDNCRNCDFVRVTSYLQQMGVPAHLKGYYYLRSAVVISLYESNTVSSVTKLLYPRIAKEFYTTEQKVERGIRNAIEVTWKQGDPDFLQTEFGCGSFRSVRPSNSECIARIVDRMRVGDMAVEEILI